MDYLDIEGGRPLQGAEKKEKKTENRTDGCTDPSDASSDCISDCLESIYGGECRGGGK